MTDYQTYCDICLKKTTSKGVMLNDDYAKNSFRLTLDNFNFDHYDEGKEPDWYKARKIDSNDVCYDCSFRLAVGVRELLGRLKNENRD
jgi:hypothetical protein